MYNPVKVQRHMEQASLEYLSQLVEQPDSCFNQAEKHTPEQLPGLMPYLPWLADSVVV